jgi:hypothetical protein
LRWLTTTLTVRRTRRSLRSAHCRLESDWCTAFAQVSGGLLS